VKRRGFTLIELVVSLSVVGVLTMAIGSSIVISTRTLPTANGFSEMQASAGRSLTLLGDDIRLATSVAAPDVRTLTLWIPDQTGDNAPETVEYQWSGSAGDSFTREFNGAGQNSLLSDIIDLEFIAIKGVGYRAGDRTSTPADRVRIDILAGTREAVEVSAEYRFFNTRMP
jgi:prepilin-type N-terminal cleavage/methylation domain-containing protein